MKSRICKMLGIEFPLIAFTHCRDVVVEVAKAGGMGVMGIAGMPAEQLEIELSWIDDNIDGLPYGVDVLIPNAMVTRDSQPTPEQVLAMVPQEHKRFASQILEDHDIDTSDINDERRLQSTGFGDNLRPEGAKKVVNVAFSHPIRLIANALGVPPDWLLQMGKERGVPVAALVGAKQHAINQVKAGVDILVVSGTEGGGHCGSVSSMVLIPEIYEAIQEYGDVPILAAGGIMTGKQMAAAMAMGADGAWTGSIWLTTTEAETSEVMKQKFIEASSSQTVRSRSRTGKHARQLSSAWTEAWESEGSPEPLPMPLQTIVSEPALSKVRKLGEIGHEGAIEVETYFVGQGVGLVDKIQSTRNVVYGFQQDFVKAYGRLSDFLEDS